MSATQAAGAAITPQLPLGKGGSVCVCVGGQPRRQLLLLKICWFVSSALSLRCTERGWQRGADARGIGQGVGEGEAILISPPSGKIFAKWVQDYERRVQVQAGFAARLLRRHGASWPRGAHRWGGEEKKKRIRKERRSPS